MKKVFPITILLVLLSACASSGPVFQQLANTQAADYKTFSIKKIDTQGLNPEAMVKVGQALKYALEARGMIYQAEHGELLVEYAVGIKQVNEVRLEVIPIAGSSYTDHIMENNRYGNLLISLSDAKTSKQVWYLSGSRKLDNMQSSQAEINSNVVKLMQNFK